MELEELIAQEKTDDNGWFAEFKPYPNEHAARIKAPDGFARFRRQKDKFGEGIHAIFGVTEDNKVELQSIRFDKKKFTVAEAKKWLKEHEYKVLEFEPASEEAQTEFGLLTKDFALTFDEKSLTRNGEFDGHGSVFNILDLQKDIVLPGAFLDTLERHKKEGTTVKMLWQHDAADPIGTWPKIAEDNMGLKVKGRLELEVRQGKEAYVLLKAKALGGMSIGYVTQESEFDEENRIRRLKKVDLWEVSLVTFPANPAARVNRVKDLNIRDLERMLHEKCGLSRKQAVAVAGHGFKGLLPREAKKPDMPALDDIAAAMSRFNKAVKA